MDDEKTCVHIDVCKFQRCNEPCDYYCSFQKFQNTVVKNTTKKVLKLLEAYIKEFKFEYNGDNGFIEDHISVDHLEKWFIEELRKQEEQT